MALAISVLLGAAWASAQALPAAVEAALARAKVPRDAVSLVVANTDPTQAERLSFRAHVPMNPASVMKLVTTYAGLELLGPAYSWRTPVLLDGVVRDGVLQGHLYIRGQGDPKLVTERLWLLLRRVQALGVKRIAGDIVLDRSAFDVAASDPGAFDGEPLRPYNASADALLINYKSVVMTFVPDVVNGVARVGFEPVLAGVQMPAVVPLSPLTLAGAGDCPDYRSQLKADFSDPAVIRFAGSYPAACGERVWPVAYAEPASFAARAVLGIWQEMGGQLDGKVRDGTWPKQGTGAVAPSFELSSPPLAEVIRDINKYSNNVMAQQLFLTLGLPAGTAGVAQVAASRERLAQWWRERLGDVEPPVIDNGSGLSRQSRISARSLARLLQLAYASPVMPELMSSLPIAGVDGTLKRSTVSAQGTAHLKTGSLRDVVAAAGYVLTNSGQRLVVVAIINHSNAGAARPVIDALSGWVIREY